MWGRLPPDATNSSATSTRTRRKARWWWSSPMPGIALLVFREVLEAALIITIVCAATRGVPRRGLFVGGGLILGVLGAMLVALFAGALANAFSGVGQEVFNAGVL